LQNITDFAETVNFGDKFWYEGTMHPSFSDIAIFVLKGDVKLQLTN